MTWARRSPARRLPGSRAFEAFSRLADRRRREEAEGTWEPKPFPSRPCPVCAEAWTIGEIHVCPGAG